MTEISLDALRQLAELANEWKAGLPSGDDMDEIDDWHVRHQCATELVDVLEQISGCRLQVRGTGIAPSIVGEPR